MHHWGDKDFDWDSLNDAINTIRFWGKKVGRLGGQLKEKYGTIRWYCEPNTGFKKLHDVVKNGHYYYRWPAQDKPIWYFLDCLSKPYFDIIEPITLKYKRFMYGFAYKVAVTKHPKLSEEILICCEAPQHLLKKERALFNTICRETDSI